MKTVEELTSFYTNQLRPILEQFEEKRKKLRNQILFISFIVLWNIAVIYFFFLSSIDSNSQILQFGIFLTIAIISFLYKYLQRDYRSEFKEQVIKPLIHELEPNLNYLEHAHVTQEIFERSELFSKPDKFSGNDFVSGILGKTQIQFSDIHAQKKHKDNKGKTKYSTIFQGLFIVAQFNKNFNARTVVLPDLAQSTFGNLIGSWLQSKNLSRDELIKMDNPEFEKYFVVYGTDQIEARYILTHSMMENLLEFQKKSNHDISLSFIEDHIHLAIHYGKDLFEPTVFRSILDEKITKEYIEVLHLAVSIVEQLQLNERLWSKA